MVVAEDPPVFLDSSDKEAENEEESPEGGQEILKDQPSSQDTPPAEYSA